MPYAADHIAVMGRGCVVSRVERSHFVRPGAVYFAIMPEARKRSASGEIVGPNTT